MAARTIFSTIRGGLGEGTSRSGASGSISITFSTVGTGEGLPPPNPSACGTGCSSTATRSTTFSTTTVARITATSGPRLVGGETLPNIGRTPMPIKASLERSSTNANETATAAPRTNP